MAKDVTLADIASAVGVSTVAVSKALSGKPGVSEELRDRIKAVADEMGYVAKAAVKTSTSLTGNIGVVIPENYYGDAGTFYGRLYEQVVRALYQNDYFGILELLTKEDELMGKIPKVMADGKVDGLIFLGSLKENYIRKMVEQSGISTFFLDTYISDVTFDAVISDGYYGTYQLTSYLIRKGHRKIGFVGSVDDTSSIADRYWGYRRSLRENRITFQPEWEMPDRDIVLYDKILDAPGDMDAFVCNSDYTARALIQNFEDAGYRIPEDVSVVGFDNFLPAGMEQDRITSYEVDIERMAMICVKSLIKKIEKKPYTRGIQIVTGKIVEKKTVKAKN